MSDEIKSIDELKRAQASAQAQGGSITNYSQWADILEDFETAGIESTGNYSSDVRLHEKVMDQLEQVVRKMNEVKKAEEIAPKNEDGSKVQSKTANDGEQVIKANVVNGVSSDIMSNYMKYYHLLG